MLHIPEKLSLHRQITLAEILEISMGYIIPHHFGWGFIQVTSIIADFSPHSGGVRHLDLSNRTIKYENSVGWDWH